MVDKTVIVTLPEGKSVFDIDYLGLWCKQANADFGHVIIPPMAQLNIPPYIYIPGPGVSSLILLTKIHIKVWIIQYV